MSDNGWRWGDWIEARAHYAGLKSRSALRRALDVSERHLARWLKSEHAPQLQDRSLQKLATCLRIDAVELNQYGKWGIYEPEELPLIGDPVLMLSEAGMSPQGTNQAATKRREIKGIVDTLSGDKLDRLYMQAVSIGSEHLEDRREKVAAKRMTGPKPGNRTGKPKG